MNLMRRVFLGGASAQADPYFSDVVILLHMDGVNGGSVFTDEKGATVTNVGGVTTDTGAGHFGTARGSFPGGGAYLSLPSNAAYNLAGDFTIEGFATIAADATDSSRVYSRGAYNAANNLGLEIDTANKKLSVRLNSTGGTGFIASPPNAYVAGTRFHHALFRDEAGLVALAIDGVTVASATNSGAANAATAFLIGALTGLEAGYAFKGFKDEFRVTRACRYSTATFTPPTTFPNF